MNYKYAAIIALALIIAGGFFFLFSGQQKEAKPVISILDFTQKANTGQPVQVTAKATGETKITKITSKTKSEELQQQCGQKECTALFTHTFSKPGTQQIEVAAEDSKGNTATQKIIVQIFPNEKTCIDQTPDGTCSKNKPFYCSESIQELVEKCSQCGCGSGMQCENEKCTPIPLKLEIISAEPLPAKIIKENTDFKVKIELKNNENNIVANGAKYALAAGLTSHGPMPTKNEPSLKEFTLEKDLGKNESIQIELSFNGLVAGIYSLEATLIANQKELSSFTQSNFIESSNDTTPPAAPTGLKAQATGNDVELSWAPNNEIDLAGYKIYKSGTIEPTHITYSLMQTAGNDSSKITITDLKTGGYYFVMKAFDYLGNESPYSQYIKVEKG